jgi:hypothetical protein
MMKSEIDKIFSKYGSENCRDAYFDHYINCTSYQVIADRINMDWTDVLIMVFAYKVFGKNVYRAGLEHIKLSLEEIVDRFRKYGFENCKEAYFKNTYHGLGASTIGIEMEFTTRQVDAMIDTYRAYSDYTSMEYEDGEP